MNLMPVAISSPHGSRSAMFGGSVGNFFSLGAQMPQYQPAYAPPPARYYMGQTAQDYYNRARPEIQKFDTLVERTKRIAGKNARDTVIADYGLTEAANKDKALYMRNALASDVAGAEKYSPVAYEEGFPSRGPSRGRVDKLRSFNSDFEGAVKAAEDMYGILPEPVVIERTVEVPGAAPSIVPYVVIGGLGIAALFALGVFGK
jgi:hypothetical protein